MSDWVYLEKALAEITAAMSRLSSRVQQLEGASTPITWAGTGVAGAAITILTAVSHAVVVVYSLYETAGGAVAGTVTGVGLAGTTDLYNVGGDICTLALSAGGTLTVQRTGGASTYDVSLIILPI